MEGVHHQAAEFVQAYLSSGLNAKAMLAPLHECDYLPTDLKCPIYGINQLNLDDRINRALTAVRKGARIICVRSADGRSQQCVLYLPLMHQHQQQHQQPSGGRTELQTLDRPLLAIVGAFGCALALYYRWQNGIFF